jgi:hypothetical protein
VLSWRNAAMCAVRRSARSSQRSRMVDKICLSLEQRSHRFISAGALVDRPQDLALRRPVRPSAVQRGLLRHPPARPARRFDGEFAARSPTYAGTGTVRLYVVGRVPVWPRPGDRLSQADRRHAFEVSFWSVATDSLESPLSPRRD